MDLTGMQHYAQTPFWLNDALEEFKSRHKQSQIIVMFHETWASGKPWKREFWHASAQKRCARRLLSVASRVVTSVRQNAQMLKTLRAHEPILLIPIGSSFNTQERTQKNWKHLLIFGQEHARRRAVNVHKRLIEALDRASSIETIILAGQIRDPSRDQSRELLAGLNLKSAITTCYNFSSDAIPDVVRECGLALMHTQSVYLSLPGLLS